MPGSTIDNFSMEVNFQYARRTELLEQVRQQYHLQEASTVPAQALIIDLYPKLTELDLLLGVAALHAPWAHFYPPKKFPTQRRSPFTFHRLIPSFGSSEQERKYEEQLDTVECKTPEQQQQKTTMKSFFTKLSELNGLLRYIRSRIGQFLQG